MPNKKLYTNAQTKKVAGSQIEIEAEIPHEIMEGYRTKALTKLNGEVSLAGFRSGHIPEKVLVDAVGELKVLEHAAELAFPDVLLALYNDHSIQAVGQPNVSITKIARGTPLAFKVTTAVLPEFDLPNYKKIAADVMSKTHEAEAVTEKEITDVLEELRKNVAAKNGKDPKDAASLPPIDAAFAKEVGGFDSLEALKAKVTENMTEEKKFRAREKNRLELVNALTTPINVEIPEVMIEGELERMLARFNDDINRMGIKPDDYLTHLKKTREDLRKEWRADAEKKVKLDLLIAHIAKNEKLHADPEIVKKEATHLLSHHKDANPERINSYVEMVLTQEKVFEFLESQKK